MFHVPEKILKPLELQNYIMKSPSIQLKELPNKIFLLELQNRLRENKIKESQLAKILTELTFTQNEQALSTVFEEWVNDPEEQAEIKIWKGVEDKSWSVD